MSAERTDAAIESSTSRQLSGSALVCVIACCGVFVWINYTRLYHSDLWGHLSYGRWMWNHGRLPEFEPLMPLSRDVPMLATAWLSQLCGFLVMDTVGPHGLQLLHGITIAVVFALVCRAVYGRSQNAIASLIAGACMLLIARGQVLIIRPQLVGMCCFSALVALLQSDARSWRRTLAVAALFVFWANAHPSFPAGLILLATYALIQIVTVVRRGSLASLVVNSELRWLVPTGVVAGLAVLANPYGFDLYEEVFRVSANPNLRVLRDWQPVNFRSQRGMLFVGSLVVFLVTTGLAKRREAMLSSATVLAAVGTVFSSRMLSWYAVLAGVAIGTHLATRLSTRASVAKWRTWPVAVIAVLIALAASPLWRVASGQELPLVAIASRSTPCEATEFLREEYDGNGLIFAPNTWGDFLTWRSNGALPVLVNSHAHLIQAETWHRYRRVSIGQPDCLAALLEAEVCWVLVNSGRRRLLAQLEASSEWEPVFENDRSAIFRRQP